MAKLLEQLKNNRQGPSQTGLTNQIGRGNAIYVPNRYDPTDKLLGDFLCKFNEHEKLKILFLRESEGVYRFGQKRVYIKVGKHNQILVKVGGGFLRIDEFIKLYTDEEVNKIRRNDVFQRFHQKLEV
jgi:hypothetical protein